MSNLYSFMGETHPARARLLALTRECVDVGAAYQHRRIEGNAEGARDELRRLIALEDEALGLLRPLIAEFPQHAVRTREAIGELEYELFNLRLTLDRNTAVTYCDVALADHVCKGCGRGYRCQWPTLCGDHKRRVFGDVCPPCSQQRFEAMTKTPPPAAAGGRLGRFMP